MKKPHRSTLWRHGIKAKTKTFHKKPIKRDRYGHFVSGTGRYATGGNWEGVQGKRPGALKSLQWRVMFLLGVLVGFLLFVCLTLIPGQARADTYVIDASKIGIPIAIQSNCADFLDYLGYKIDKTDVKPLLAHLEHGEPQPGDVILYDYGTEWYPLEYHVAEYLGDGYVLEANYTPGVIDVRSITMHDIWLLGYIKKQYLYQ